MIFQAKHYLKFLKYKPSDWSLNILDQAVKCKEEDNKDLFEKIETAEGFMRHLQVRLMKLEHDRLRNINVNESTMMSHMIKEIKRSKKKFMKKMNFFYTHLKQSIISSYHDNNELTEMRLDKAKIKQKKLINYLVQENRKYKLMIMKFENLISDIKEISKKIQIEELKGLKPTKKDAKFLFKRKNRKSNRSSLSNSISFSQMIKNMKNENHFKTKKSDECSNKLDKENNSRRINGSEFHDSMSSSDNSSGCLHINSKFMPTGKCDSYFSKCSYLNGSVRDENESSSFSMFKTKKINQNEFLDLPNKNYLNANYLSVSKRSNKLYRSYSQKTDLNKMLGLNRGESCSSARHIKVNPFSFVNNIKKIVNEKLKMKQLIKEKKKDKVAKKKEEKRKLYKNKRHKKPKTHQKSPLKKPKSRSQTKKKFKKSKTKVSKSKIKNTKRDYSKIKSKVDDDNKIKLLRKNPKLALLKKKSLKFKKSNTINKKFKKSRSKVKKNQRNASLVKGKKNKKRTNKKKQIQIIESNKPTNLNVKISTPRFQNNKVNTANWNLNIKSKTAQNSPKVKKINKRLIVRE